MEVYMFFKNDFRPAFATADACGQASGRKMRNDAFTYDAGASETDDFGSFSSRGSAGNNAPKNTQKKSGVKPAAVGIAIAAVVAVVLLIVLIVAFASSNGGHIKYENNTFVSFCDEDGIYHVAANGRVVGEYESEIELRVADDRSFAYIIENSEDGYRISITYGKDAEEVTPSPVTKILATATLSPGIVWLDNDNNSIYHYTESRGEEKITKDVDLTGANTDNHSFCISADGETVAYTKMNADDPQAEYLFVYNDGMETRFQKNMAPVAISNDGSLIYAKATRDNIVYSLYVLPFSDDNADRYLISENFYSIVDINTDGDEIVFTTINDAEISTYLVAFNIKKMDEVAQPTRIGKGAIYTPVSIDPEVACLSTFADCYFECNIGDIDITLEYTAPVYYVNKKFEIRRISKYAGKFDPDGDYFYYTNNEKTLQRVDLSDEDAVSEKIAEDVVDFAITQKGNVYWLNDASTLMFHDVSKSKNKRIADNVEAISMYDYSNTLYFSFVEAVSIYATEEGSDEEVVKFDSATITGLPYFADSNTKKTFATFYDEDNEEWRLFYTSNGKSFKVIATCDELDGFDVSFSFEDIVNNIVNSIGGGSDTSTDTTDTSAE